MPVHCRISFQPLTVEEFKELDYRVMGHAFDCQNALGRLCDEAIYESDLADRLRRDGFRRVVCQLPLTVTHRDFVKTYYLDLVVDGALYELKTVSSLNTRHDAQLINYMLLLGQSCGKLLNFGSDRVEGQLVVSAVTHEIRRKYEIDASRWLPISPACKILRSCMEGLLADWGAFLELSLYQEALVHRFGGPASVIQRVPLARGQVPLGTQLMHLHDGNMSFVVTALTRNQSAFEGQLQKLLNLSPLAGIQWLNLDHEMIQFVTLVRPKPGDWIGRCGA